MATKTITVFGATGLQGGSVVRALLQDDAFKVRGVTRNPDSDAAKALQAKGVEIIQADYDDKDSVVKAVTGVYGCFAVTDSWALCDKAREIQQGINLVDACKTAGVQHLVYSGLESTEKLAGAPCVHFDGKAEVGEYLQASGVPYTIIHLAGYCENYFKFTPQKIGEDKYAMFIPMGDVPMYVIPGGEIGECVHQIILQRDQFLGKMLGLASDVVTIEQLAAIMAKHLGKDIVDGKITLDAYAKLGFPGAGELVNMFAFFQSGKWHRDIELTKKLDPTISGFEQWVSANKEGLLKAMPQ